MGLFVICLYTFTIKCATTGTRNMPLEYMFALFVANNVYQKTFLHAQMQENYS